MKLKTNMFNGILLFGFMVSANALVASEHFTVCRKSEPKIEECLKNTLENLRPTLIKGSKKLKIPSVEPMIVPLVKVLQGSGPVSIDSTFTNLKVSGISAYEVTNISADYDIGRINLSVDIPYLYMVGDYEIKGQILVLPITGKGDSWSNYTGVHGTMVLRMQPIQKGDETYMRLEKLSFDIKVDKAVIHMNNLFNGNKQLGDVMNQFMSENWEVVFQELKPVIDTAISAILQGITTQVFDKFTKNELFPN